MGASASGIDLLQFDFYKLPSIFAAAVKHDTKRKIDISKKKKNIRVGRKA